MGGIERQIAVAQLFIPQVRDDLREFEVTSRPRKPRMLEQIIIPFGEGLEDPAIFVGFGTEWGGL